MGEGRRCKYREERRTFLTSPECINTREGARCVRRGEACPPPEQDANRQLPAAPHLLPLARLGYFQNCRLFLPLDVLPPHLPPLF